VFAERGYEGAALSDIARGAGFTTGAIYSCFRDKAELLLEVVRSIVEAEQSAAVEAAAAGVEGDADARFVELAREFIGGEQALNRALVLEAHVASRRDPEVGKLLREFQSARLMELIKLVEAAQATGYVDKSIDPDAVATLFMAIPLGLVVLDAAGVDIPDSSSWARLAEYTAGALRPRNS
jgi:AcrR family transcriptional regulator